MLAFSHEIAIHKPNFVFLISSSNKHFSVHFDTKLPFSNAFFLTENSSNFRINSHPLLCSCKLGFMICGMSSETQKQFYDLTHKIWVIFNVGFQRKWQVLWHIISIFLIKLMHFGMKQISMTQQSSISPYYIGIWVQKHITSWNASIKNFQYTALKSFTWNNYFSTELHHVHMEIPFFWNRHPCLCRTGLTI